MNLLPLFLGLSNGCIGHQNVELNLNYDYIYTQDHLQNDIERELSKHDPISLSFLERDMSGSGQWIHTLELQILLEGQKLADAHRSNQLFI